MSKKITKISLSPIKVLTPNGFSHRIVTKRPVMSLQMKGICINASVKAYLKRKKNNDR